MFDVALVTLSLPSFVNMTHDVLLTYESISVTVIA